MGHFERFIACCAEATRQAEVYEERHARYRLGSYDLLARQLRVVAHLWLQQAIDEARRLQVK